jgi:exodeoxyribonuclease VII small subunit
VSPSAKGTQSSGGDKPPAGYAEALDEIEEILASLEEADVDVDVLASRVQRAALLISFCRERIGAATAQIEQAVAGLDGH